MTDVLKRSHGAMYFLKTKSTERGRGQGLSGLSPGRLNLTLFETKHHESFPGPNHLDFVPNPNPLLTYLFLSLTTCYSPKPAQSNADHVRYNRTHKVAGFYWGGSLP